MEQTEHKRPTVSATRALKLALDAVMLVLLVLMYKKQVISMAFHEIGGLALIGLFVIHHLVNGRWIAATTRKLFSKTTPAMVRARYIVDVLLLIAFLAVGVTGVLINKTLFTVRVAGNAQTLHYFSAALAVLLMGVHLGLHADYIFGKMFRRGANRIAKIAVGVVIAAMIAFGGYSLATMQFVSYLAAPVRTAQFTHGSFQPDGDVMLDGSFGELPRDLSELPQLSGDNAMLPPQSGDSAFPGEQVDTRPFATPDGAEGAREGGSEGSAASAALLIAQYVSIIALFGAATYGIVRLVGKKKRSAVDPAIKIVEDQDDLPADYQE